MLWVSMGGTVVGFVAGGVSLGFVWGVTKRMDGPMQRSPILLRASSGKERCHRGPRHTTAGALTRLLFTRARARSRRVLPPLSTLVGLSKMTPGAADPGQLGSDSPPPPRQTRPPAAIASVPTAPGVKLRGARARDVVWRRASASV